MSAAQDTLELWINNDYSLYVMFVEEYRSMIDSSNRGEVVKKLARKLEAYYDEIHDTHDGVIYDLLLQSLISVNWEGLAADLLAD